MRPDPEALLDSFFIAIGREICKKHGVDERCILIRIDPRTGQKTFMVNDPELSDETKEQIIMDIMERCEGMLE